MGGTRTMYSYKAEGLVKLLLSFETVAAFMLLLKVKSVHYLYSLPDLVGTVWGSIYIFVYISGTLVSSVLSFQMATENKCYIV